MINSIKTKNQDASNVSGVRPNFLYKNVLDQERYISVLSYVKNKNVLDCACGVGWGSHIMAMAGAIRVIGVDLSLSAINTARNFYNSDSVTYIQNDINQINIKENFDVITSFETIEHVENPIEFLQKLRSLSHPKTVFFLSTPNGFCFKHSGDKPYNPFHLDEYEKNELIEMFNNSGWSVKNYMGQYPMKEGSKKIDEYREFIKIFWLNKNRIQKFGFLYSITSKIFRRITKKLIQDPAHNYSCAPVTIKDGYQPAYHFFKLMPIKKDSFE
jgi:2-polyprenyl-3-methyl-5-hydroxy-6-metoxy-1,4-benzoquinol methylase